MQKTRGSLPPEWARAVRRFQRKRDMIALGWAVALGTAAAIAAGVLMGVIISNVFTLGAGFPVAP